MGTHWALLPPPPSHGKACHVPRTASLVRAQCSPPLRHREEEEEVPVFLRGEAFLVPGTAERPQKAAEGQQSQAITGGPAC